MKSTILLTTGLSGSSLVTGLLARAGYWTGDETFKKVDYDTHENQDLVDLNRQLLEAAAAQQGTGEIEKYSMIFSRDSIDQVTALYGKIDPAPYAEFVARCNAHSPWLWKDPRLWLSMGFWKNLLDLKDLHFVVVTRDPTQMWIATTLRRHIQTYRHLSSYCEAILGSIVGFLEENQLEYVEVGYEELIVHPEKTIEKLNAHLGTELSVEDLRATFKGRLYRKPKGTIDLIKAVMIYLKNYSSRYK